MLRNRMLLAVVLLFSVHSSAFADDESDLAASALYPMNIVDWRQMTIRVVDSVGKPISGATVRFISLVANNGSGWWQDVLHGVPPKAISDADGQAIVQIPRTIHPIRKHQVGNVEFLVSHRDYCSKNVRFDVPADGSKTVREAQLENGMKLRIAGVSPGTEQPLPHCHVLLEGRQVDELEFIRDDEGWMNSVTVNSNRRWFRVVYAPPNSAIQFSRLHAWDPAEAPKGGLRFDVHPGVRVIGRLPDHIPRPVKTGYVVVCCGSTSRPKTEERSNTMPVWWDEVARFQPDGSFEFASLPPGHVAQFFAFADDWVSSQPSTAAFETLCKCFPDDGRRNRPGWFRFGQVLRLAGKSQEIELEMDRAGTVRVRCVDQKQNPLRGITVGFWPNYIVMGDGGGLFCEHRSTLDFLEGRSKWAALHDSPFHAESTSDGIAIVRSIPADKQSMVVGTEFWTSRDKVWAADQEILEIEVRAGEVVEQTIELHRAR